MKKEKQKEMNKTEKDKLYWGDREKIKRAKEERRKKKSKIP